VRKRCWAQKLLSEGDVNRQLPLGDHRSERAKIAYENEVCPILADRPKIRDSGERVQSPAHVRNRELKVESTSSLRKFHAQPDNSGGGHVVLNAEGEWGSGGGEGRTEKTRS